jgi:hypothetical protein
VPCASLHALMAAILASLPPLVVVSGRLRRRIA